LVVASAAEIDVAWTAATNAWGLFEVNDYGTLSYANFEEPKTRGDAYGYSCAWEIDTYEVERHGSLNQRIKDVYRETLIDAAEDEFAINDPDYDAIDEKVEDDWSVWFNKATGKERDAIDDVIETWLEQEPDWSNESDDIYKSGTAQGAAYDHFLREDCEVMEALGIVIIEGDCPGSSYFAAELHMSPEDANDIAEAHGWQIRFVTC
jgi:hypothetical protein